MAFMNPMQQFGGGFPGGGMPGGGMPGGGGLMGQFERGSMDGSLVGKEKMIAGSAIMDEKMTEAAAKSDGVITPQERMAIMAKKCKAQHIMNGLRTNGMGNMSREALMRKGGQGGPGGPGGFGGPGGPGGCHHHHHGQGQGGVYTGGPAVGANGVQAVSAASSSNGSSSSWSMAASWSSSSTGGAQAQAFAGPRGASAFAGF